MRPILAQRKSRLWTPTASRQARNLSRSPIFSEALYLRPKVRFFETKIICGRTALTVCHLHYPI
jgi:hypothetical protein